MKILSINAGSSSLKFTLFDMKDETVIASGVFERIGIDGSNYYIKYNGEKISEDIELNNHTDAVNALLEKLVALEIIKSLDEIEGIGHRVVSGGSKYSESVLVTDQVIKDIEELIGYNKKYLVQCLRKNEINYATATYYLMLKDELNTN